MSQQRMMYHRWRADKEFAAVSSDARDLFYGLMGVCDHWGCLKLNPVPIRNEAFLGAEELPPVPDVQKWLDELVGGGILRVWEHEDKEYAELKWFIKEQRIRYRGRRQTPVPPWHHEPHTPAQSAPDSTGGTPQHSPHTSAQPAHDSSASAGTAAEEKRREERRGEEKNPPDGLPSLRSEDEEGPGTTGNCGPPHGALETPAPDGGASADGHAGSVVLAGEGASPSGSITLERFASGLPPPESPQEARAWEVILAHAARWGPVLPSTLRRLASLVRRRPQIAVAWVLATEGNPRLKSPWGALCHALKQPNWAPPQSDEDRARPLVKPRDRGGGGVASLGGALEQVIERRM